MSSGCQVLSLRNNPIREVRVSLGLTLKQASSGAGIHLQAFYLQEQGCHPDIFPSVITWIERQGYWRPNIVGDYYKFQHAKRVEAGEFYDLRSYEWEEPEPGPPFELFRLRCEPPLSRSAFAKRFCVHPGVLYRVEECPSKYIPPSLLGILYESGLNQEAIDELVYRQEEWYDGVV